VLCAVNQNGLALKYVDESLRGDREVVLAASKQAAQQVEPESGAPAPVDVLKFATKAMQHLVPRLRHFRPFQRLLLACTECRGADCLTAPPLVLGAHLPFSLDIREMVAVHLDASSTVPKARHFEALRFDWHAAQVRASSRSRRTVDSGERNGSERCPLAEQTGRLHPPYSQG
jgi:hypothetical protein